MFQRAYTVRAMSKRDARQLSEKAQEELRVRAIKMHKDGVSGVKISKYFEVNPVTVSNWIKKYRQGGMAALKSKRRGVRKGTRSKLTEGQIKEVRKMITDKNPDQLKLGFALWTVEAVALFLFEQYGVTYSNSHLAALLKAWGFTPQRPLKRAYEQRPEAVRAWREEVFPEIQKAAKEEDAEIWWGDEACVQPEAKRLRGFSPKGRTPELRQPAKHFRTSYLSALSNTGKMHWMNLPKALDSDLFIDFLTRLLNGRRRKIYLIVDNLRVHHSEPVRHWLSSRKARIELRFLPSYSPDLNPDEYLHHTLKQRVKTDPPALTDGELRARVHTHLDRLRDEPALLRRLFLHPKVAYAA